MLKHNRAPYENSSLPRQGRLALAAGLVSLALLAPPTSAEAAKKHVNKVTAFAEKIAKIVHQGGEFPLNPQPSMVQWVKPGQAGVEVTDMAISTVIKNKPYYFQLNQEGSTLSSIVVSEIPSQDIQAIRPSSILYQGVHINGVTSPEIVTTEALVQLNSAGQPFVEASLSTGQTVQAPLGVTTPYTGSPVTG